MQLVSFATDYLDELEPNTPMIELIASLRDAGLRMALLTNNVLEWDSHWRAMAPIEEIFELVPPRCTCSARKSYGEKPGAGVGTAAVRARRRDLAAVVGEARLGVEARRAVHAAQADRALSPNRPA